MRAKSACFVYYSLCILALRESRTAEELSVRAYLYDHRLSALVTDYIGRLIGYLYPLALHILFSLCQHLVKACVELSEYVHPVSLACFYLIKVAFHLSGKLCVNYTLKVTFHKVGYNYTERGRL